MLCFAILAIQYARSTPYFEAPDEGSHFLYVHNLLEEGELPTLPENRVEVIEGDDATQIWSLERHQPPLYYLIGAILISPTQRNDIEDYLIPNPLLFIRQLNPPNIWLHIPEDTVSGDTSTAIWILRGFSLTLSLLSLWFIYRIANLAFPDDAILGVVVLGFVAFIPNFIAVSATVTNDTLVIFLYTLGIYRVLRVWRQESIYRRDMIILSLVLALIALTKLTGLTLFGVVYLALFLGLFRKKFTQKQVFGVITISLIATALIAGWWYIRNYSLYGDPLATDANLSFWERDNSPTSLDEFEDEAERVWESFWLMLGHPRVLPNGEVDIPIEGPSFVYVYVTGISLLGVLGVFVAFWRKPPYRDVVIILSSVCGLLVLALIWGTRQVEISYGRLLFPALGAFSTLMVLGWVTLIRSLGDMLGRLLPHNARFSASLSTVVPIGMMIPLIAVAISAPSYLRDGFPRLEIFEDLPQTAIEVGEVADGLELIGYELDSEIVAPEDTVKLWLYIRGQNSENPALFVNVLDPTVVEMGGIDFYPGMSPTSRLNPDVIYRVPVELQLDEVSQVMRTRRLDYYVGWQIPSTEQYVQWETIDGRTDTLPIPGATMINQELSIPEFQYPIDIVFGNTIKLQGVSFSTTDIEVGEELVVQLVWGYEGMMDLEWNTVIQLVNDDGDIAMELIEAPIAYPTTAWRPAPDFGDIRRLMISEDMAEGDYHLRVGWVNSDDEFLTFQSEGGELLEFYEIQVPIHVR